MDTGQERSAILPIRHDLRPTYALSLVIAILMAVASIAGIIYRTAIYPADDLLRTFVSNDAVNLLVGLPILLGSMWLTWRGRLIGLLCWSGALLFILYNYIAYVFALPLNSVFFLHLAIVAMTAFTLVALVANIDGKAIKESLTGVVHERIAGSVLAILGLLFFLRAIGVIINALVGGADVSKAELAVDVSDSLIAPAWVVGGILLWWRRELGYVIGLGLLIGISMLFVALIIFMLLQPYLTTAPFAVADIFVVSVMGLICFIPLFLFGQGIRSKRYRDST